VRRSLTEGKPIPENCDLGIAYRRFAEAVLGNAEKARKKTPILGLKAIFSEN
jgi:hypothetical protein